MSQMSERYGVMGNPIAHSRSPQIHQWFAAQTGESMSYEAILVELGGFAQAVADFQIHGGKGLNVTVPFKPEAWDLAAERSARAELAGAANTLAFRPDGSVFADNTDGVGLVRDLTVNAGIPLKDKRILVIGGGGAVRGVLGPLLEARPELLVIANRTVAKAAELARLFEIKGNVEACGFQELARARFDLVINGTSASLSGDIPDLPMTAVEGAVCYDMMYDPWETAFMGWAATHGAAGVRDGLGMLVEQAAESFELWRGVRPDTQPVIRELRDVMQQDQEKPGI